ncbi:iron-sulfur cluster-binding domain-containing protein [Orbus wheelerorum]|uniref:flavin reductase family protein n=1 Tax=Orbus wheelerorum TaxID=3074111 RepID=UPI00370D2EE5
MTYQNIPLVLILRKKETDDTESFYFQSKKPLLFNFKPGQFILLEANINGNSQVRAYSISSQPNSPSLKLTIKRVKDGLVSNWLIDNLALNNQITLRSIGGEFNIIDVKYKKKILFISAGCGITPVTSMAQYLLDQKIAVDIDFLHCAKDEFNIIYYLKLQQMAKQYRHFNYHLRLKNSSTEPALMHSSIGRITDDFLIEHYSNLDEYTIFLCGSHRFMTDIANNLKSLNFDMDQFHYESFTLESCLDDKLSDKQGIKVTVADFNFEQTAAIDDNLLTILESGQLPIIGACRSGVCGACKCKIEHGEVISTSYATLSQQEIEQGYHLACSTIVKSDVDVSLS